MNRFPSNFRESTRASFEECKAYRIDINSTIVLQLFSGAVTAESCYCVVEGSFVTFVRDWNGVVFDLRIECEFVI